MKARTPSSHPADGGEPADRRSMAEPIGRIDADERLRERLLPLCRLARGEIWEDPVAGHRVGVLDATDRDDLRAIVAGDAPTLCIADPPYNVVVGSRNTPALGQSGTADYDRFTEDWLDAALPALASSASFYAWLGADMRNGFHPLPEFCVAMRGRPEWSARNWITVRNQRGHGTRKNWMWVRQELLYYVRNAPPFNIEADYTDIPKKVTGYYKQVSGKRTENTERGRAGTIRAGNVWVDIQQVFYRLHENVPGCYAQKPLKAIERIVRAGSREGEAVLDPFAHSGTTLLAAEMLGRRCLTFDIDPVFAEIAIRRLERLRATGRTGWQCEHPFPELLGSRR